MMVCLYSLQLSVVLSPQLCELCHIFYYPPRDIFALNTGKYGPGCIFFVYTGAPVLWIMSVNNFRFFNNISESMQLTNMYNISLERCYCSASTDVCCIKIHAEMTEILQVKD